MDNGNGQDVPIWWTDLQYEMYMYIYMHFNYNDK